MTNRMYEEPSRLSQGLVVSLSVAVVLMAGWLAATITLSQTTMTPVEDATGATAAVSASDGASSLPTTLHQSRRSNSVHFDWPAEFTSSLAAPAAPPPVQAALPLAPEVAPAREVGRAPWPAAPDARDLPSRQAAESTDAIVDILAPPAPPRGALAAPPPRPAQAQRRKPRVVETEPVAQ